MNLNERLQKMRRIATKCQLKSDKEEITVQLTPLADE